MAGYSGTPLEKKLGIKENFHLAFINAPDGFDRQLELPSGVVINSTSRKPLDFMLLFVKGKRELEKRFIDCSAKLKPAGILWICWPKKSSGVVSDLNENVVREIGLGNGMVDVKVCAVDEIWSGLKFVLRLKDRKRA